MNNFLSLKDEFLPHNYRPNCKIRAQNDVEAVQRFLDEYFDKPTTFRSYKKETDRFLVWCLKQQKTSLSAFDRDDVEDYIKFLQDPKPREIWCGGDQGQSKWRPFRGPLGESAIKTSLTILNSMMTYLLQANYLDHNPFALIRRKQKFSNNLNDIAITINERILNEEEWQAILCVLNNIREEDDKIEKFKKNRLKFLVYTLYFLGLRIDELSRSTWNAFRKINDKWWFFIRGKGDKLGKVPINTSYLSSVISFRHFLKLPPLPLESENSFLIPNIHNTHGLTVRQMSNLLKELSLKAAQNFSPESLSHKKLKRFSPHWLRHLSASRQDLAGISFTNIKSNLRHQNEQTTRQYVHAHDDDRHKEMELLRI